MNCEQSEYTKPSLSDPSTIRCITYSLVFRLGTHARSVLYLSSQLSAHGNAFMRYFHDILLLEDLDSIYWMGMPHDDAFDIINTVRPSEKFAGQ